MTISNVAQAQQIIQSINALQTQGNTLQQQISTGLKGQSYADYGAQAGQIVNLSAQTAQQQGYLDTINTVDTRLGVMNQVTSTMATLMQQFSSALSSDAYNTAGNTIQSQAQGLLAQVGDYINTQDGEGYVFSGAENSTAPYDPSGLPNPGDLVTPVNGAPPAGYYAGDNTVTKATVDNNLTVSYGVTGNNPAFEQVIRVLNYLANAPAFDPNNPADVANVNQAQQLVSQSATQLQQLNASIGEQTSELNGLQTAHQSTLTLAQSNLSNITQVNTATAITQLDTLQTQLEASYQTVNVLQGLSLANYLK
jgi:flagellar hook-associated protein 3 FlgL